MSSAGTSPFTAVPGGTRIALRIQPRASRTEIAGRYGDALRVRIAAPPVDGAANDALLRFLATRLAVGRSMVELVTGASGRSKSVVVHGMTPAEAEAKLLGPPRP